MHLLTTVHLAHKDTIQLMVNLVPPAAIILLDVLSVDLLATVVAVKLVIQQTAAHA